MAGVTARFRNGTSSAAARELAPPVTAGDRPETPVCLAGIRSAKPQTSQLGTGLV